MLVFSLLKILFNGRQTCFFSSGIEMIPFGVTISTLVSAERFVMAASRLLLAFAACVILLSLQVDFVNRIGVAA